VQHVVIGAGEVGSAVSQVLSSRYDVHLRDLVASGPAKAEVLHICYPYSDTFVATAERYMQSYAPSLTIVHSTVPVGTCTQLNAVHSPIRGRHPFLVESILTFVKFFGGARSAEAAQLFSYCGVQTRSVPDAKITEAAKLWELVQYGLQIVVEKQVWAWCKTQGLDFDVIYTEFAQTYNQGYDSLDQPQFHRPIITHIPGPIGGHCIVPCSALLDHALAAFVAKAGGVK
jgi:UDP-N-acetyl-D-mannosaminuronate dehydrogenase